MDIAAGNWGLNTLYKPTAERPIRLYYGDFTVRNTVDLVEAEWDREGKSEIPRRNRNMLSLALPDLAQRFPTHSLFSHADIQQILGLNAPRAKHVDANFLASAVFLNRGDHFEISVLPAKRNWPRPSQSTSRILTATAAKTCSFRRIFSTTLPRRRAPMPAGDCCSWAMAPDISKRSRAAESGIRIYGEQRGAAVCDFDHDGRPDLVVTQNGAQTVLLRNTRAATGVRVKLNGPPSNPLGVGATIRIKAGDKLGPARQISAGSGYLSQDGPWQILATAADARECVVTWPGGKQTAVPIKARTQAVTVHAPN